MSIVMVLKIIMANHKYLIILPFVVSSILVLRVNADSYCNPQNTGYKLWDCKGETASFNEYAYGRVSSFIS